METQVISNETLVIEVERKKGSILGGIGRVFAFTFGGFGILISALLFVTIIGIFPAIGLFFMSLGLIYASLGKQAVKCPHCKKRHYVVKTAENMTCSKCRRLTVINWK